MMILWMEIALFVLGIALIVKGKLNVNESLVIEGNEARALGAVALLPWPLSKAIAFVVAFIYVFHGKDLGDGSYFTTVTLIEFGVVVGCGVLLGVLASKLGRHPTQKPIAEIKEPGHS